MNKEISPSEVVVTIYMAANQGKYSEVEKYFSIQTKTTISIAQGFGGSNDIMKNSLEQSTRNRTIEKIEILKEEIQDTGLHQRATVNFRLHFKDGKIQDVKKTLVKEKERWKIDWM